MSQSPSGERVAFWPTAWEDCRYRHEHDDKLSGKINALIENAAATLTRAPANPRRLGGNLSGWWSWRISHEHRLTYRVVGSGKDQTLQIAQCRYHY
jgi:toxin YoeB